MEGFFLGFVAGYSFRGLFSSESTRTRIVNRTETELVTGPPVSQRYALFTPKTREEALRELQSAYDSIYEAGQIKVERFDEEGDLVMLVTNEGEEPFEDTDETIVLEEFSKQRLLTIELFDERMSPYAENLLIARYLAENSNRDGSKDRPQ